MSFLRECEKCGTSLQPNRRGYACPNCHPEEAEVMSSLNYYCNCCHCNKVFSGDKRDVVCPECREWEDKERGEPAELSLPQPNPERFSPENEPSTELNLNELLTGSLNRLRFIQRFNTALVLHRESVAEHSYYVVLYSYILAQWCQQRYKMNLDRGAILERAIVHDIEESETGDFPRPFKYSNPELKKLLELQGEALLANVLCTLLPGEYKGGSLSDWESWKHDPGYIIRTHILDRWKRSKDSSYEGKIVQLADFM
jgi:5'-deoxynucleotidase YfbR-like HD superfamily hydrolase